MINDFKIGDLVSIKKNGYLDGKISGVIIGTLIKRDNSVYYIIKTNVDDHICRANELIHIDREF